MTNLFTAGSGIRFLNSTDKKKYGKRIEMIGQVSDAIASHNVETMKELLDQCNSMRMPRAAKRRQVATQALSLMPRLGSAK